MSNQPARSYTRVAVAITVAAVLISASIFVALRPTTTTVTVTSTFVPNCPSSAACATFTYSPTSQVEVLSVQATQRVCDQCGAVNGQTYVYFSLVFENIGAVPIYVFGGIDYCEPINMTVPSDSILQSVASAYFACAGAVVQISPGQNYTVYAPSGGGVSYYLSKLGQAQVDFTFDWGLNDTSVYPYTINVTADFGFTGI